MQPTKQNKGMCKESEDLPMQMNKALAKCDIKKSPFEKEIMKYNVSIKCLRQTPDYSN